MELLGSVCAVLLGPVNHVINTIRPQQHTLACDNKTGCAYFWSFQGSHATLQLLAHLISCLAYEQLHLLPGDQHLVAFMPCAMLSMNSIWMPSHPS